MTPETGRPVISILVVDDDEATLNLLGTFLRRNGYRVLAASNPVRGLELLKGELDIKLVITDLMMPHVDGIDFTRQIHALEQYKNVPVIMMTAFGNDNVLDKSYGAPRITKDGVTVAKEIELENRFENMGAQMVKEVAVVVPSPAMSEVFDATSFTI